MKKNIKRSPTMLLILDGFGYSTERSGNAVVAANMPTWKNLLKKYPNVLLHASGEHVGLPYGYSGNSEVGHLTLGAGRAIETILSKWNKIISDGSFFENSLLIRHFTELKKGGGALHLMGLLSDGGVHSHERHLYALLKIACDIGLKNVFIHAFLDGRDVQPGSAITYIKRLEEIIMKFSCGTIASLHGRFYSMDRDKNWDRTEKTYSVLVTQKKQEEKLNWQEVIKNSYDGGVTDEFIVPTNLDSRGTIKSGDGVIFFNFRPDRAHQITESFIDPHFSHFTTQKLKSDDNSLSFFITVIRYKQKYKLLNNPILFESKEIRHTLLDEISNQKQVSNSKVFIIAETEKYAHVTYFFKGMRDEKFINEKRVLIPSIKTKNYKDIPEMSAHLITQNLLDSLQNNPADFYLVNYANADMVGHSGNFNATVKACEVLDQQITKLYTEVVENQDGTIIIVGDHGNAEEKIDLKTGLPLTAHTSNPVPFILIGKKFLHKKLFFKKEGADSFSYSLANVAPTILDHLNLKIPSQMEQQIIEVSE
jgi:2,3-bisphosphoglycerate-independent phosphoglycerate mutase